MSKIKIKIRNIIEKLKNKWAYIKKEGKEHLTIMFIPHSEKRILTVHISYFTLFYIAVIVGIIIIVSVISIVSTSATKEEVSKLITMSKTYSIKEKLIRKEIEGILDNMEKLKPQIEKVYTIASATKGDDFINLWAVGGSSGEESEKEIENEIKRHGRIPEEVVYLQQLNNDLKLSEKYMERIKYFLKEREKLFSSIPSIWPLKVGGYITSDYGWRKNPFHRNRLEWHKGIDIASWPGAPVVATAAGKVIFAGWKGGYGLTVIIEHAYGFRTRYAHLSRIKTYVGKKVKRGEVIGFLGKSGLTTGYHLHYEVRIGLQDVNPWPYIINIK